MANKSKPDGGAGEGVHSRYADKITVFQGQEPPRLPSQGSKPLPDPEAQGAHTRIRWDAKNQRVYQGREFNAEGNPVRDIDFTSPTYPSGKPRPNHSPPPHQHDWKINDPNIGPRSGFKRQRSGGAALDAKTYEPFSEPEVLQKWIENWLNN